MSEGTSVLSGLPAALTPDEARQVLRIGRNRIYELIAEGQVRAVRLGKRLIVPRTELERILNGEPQQRGVAA
jgi:excisionase family DNA binding protein